MKALEILKAIEEQEGTHLWLDDGSGYPKKYIIEAIKELKDLENRSCDNCNFSNIDTYFTDYGKCEKGYGFLFNGRVEVIKDFCCNKWEAKK